MGSLINRFDGDVTRHIQSWPAWVHPIMGTASFIGEPVMFLTLAFSGVLIAKYRQQERIAWAFGAAIMAWGCNVILKQFLHRTRPDTLYVTAMRFKSYSFPSGHAFGSLLFFGLVAYLAAKHWDSPWNYLLPVAMAILILLIGLSRVYLGAHFPTDVIGGWILASIALFLIIKFILV